MGLKWHVKNLIALKYIYKFICKSCADSLIKVSSIVLAYNKIVFIAFSIRMREKFIVFRV